MTQHQIMADPVPRTAAADVVGGIGRCGPGAVPSGCTMDRMTSFDADLVSNWFSRVRDANVPGLPQWGIVPTPQELIALTEGEAQVQAAIKDLPLSGPEPPLEELPARMLQLYLGALAAGIAGTRRMLAQQAALSDDMIGNDIGPSADADALALVTGLNAAAAALHGEIQAPAYRRGRSRASEEPTAAESARLAGVTAAELVVNGAGLYEIAGSAAGAAMNGWQIGLPDDPGERVEYRVRGLVALILVALQRASRAPLPPAAPASCGAMPGENLGTAFRAEITFTMRAAADEIRALSRELALMCADVVVWEGERWPQFHLHTDQPGEVVEQIYATGMPFDLAITSLSGAERRG